MKILLLDLTPANHCQEPYEHLGLGYLASILRQHGYDVTILSCHLDNLSLKSAVNRVLSINPDLLGLSVKSIHAKWMVQIVSQLRNRGFRGHITLGGHFPTFHHQEILQDWPQIDSIVRGEGEYTLLELVERFKDKDFDQIHGLSYRNRNEIKINKPRKLIADLDQLPFPARDYANHVLKRRGVISISASRGCYANCSYCSIASFYRYSEGKKWRCRSPENMADEIKLLVKKFNCTLFEFIDDQFLPDNNTAYQYVSSFQKEVERKKLNIKFAMNCRTNHVKQDLFEILKSAGLQKVFMGIESAHQRGLNTFNKHTTVDINNSALHVLDKLGINYDVGFILIDPYTTQKELQQNLHYLSELKQNINGRKCGLSVTTSVKIFGGTPIFHKLLNERRLLGNYLHGYAYKIKNLQVRLFRFVMESIMEKFLVPCYQYFVHFRHSLNIKFS